MYVMLLLFVGQAILTWLAASGVDAKNITTGVSGFLSSGVGANLVDYFGGASSLVDECKSQNATFAHIIGAGNGAIMKSLREWMSEGKVIAVIDKEFPLDQAQEVL